MKRIALFMLFAPLAAMAFLAAPVIAQDANAPDRPSLIVTGSATVDSEADQVEISLSVVTEAKKSLDAAEENNHKAAQILEALRAAGLDAKEVSTGHFTIFPVYSANNQQRITGFRVENSIRIESKKMALAGDLIQAAVDAGANQVQSVEFTLSDRRAARADAVRQAVLNARAEANAAAGAAGVSISGIRRINVNQQFDQPRPFGAARFALQADGSQPPPLVAGNVSVVASVTVEFDITAKPANNNQ